MTWKPHRDPRTVHGFEVQYMASKDHKHEGAHRLAVAGRNVLALPDGHSTARNRNAVITGVLERISEGQSMTLEKLVGGLMLGGVVNLTVDDQAILPAGGEANVVSLRLDVVQTAPDSLDIRLAHLGGGS